MTDILFFEKPGCINGEKQKKILTTAGHHLICKNILAEKWTVESLRAFFAVEDPTKIMNYTAPDIKNGDIDPSRLSFEEAVTMMVASPILIKRPLLVVEGQNLQGFDNEKLKPYLGDWDNSEDVITCPNLATISCDERGLS